MLSRQLTFTLNYYYHCSELLSCLLISMSLCLPFLLPQSLSSSHLPLQQLPVSAVWFLWSTKLSWCWRMSVWRYKTLPMMCLPFSHSEKFPSPSSSPLNVRSLTTWESPSRLWPHDSTTVLTSVGRPAAVLPAPPSRHTLITWMPCQCECVAESEGGTAKHFRELHFFFFFFQIKNCAGRHIFPSSQHTMSDCVENSLSDPVVFPS